MNNSGSPPDFNNVRDILIQRTETDLDQRCLNWIAGFIWGIADDVLRDLYVRGKYRDVILPMTILRRLDAVLEPTKQAVLDMGASLDKAGVVNLNRRDFPGDHGWNQFGMLNRVTTDVHVHFVPPEQLTAFDRTGAGEVGADGPVMTLRMMNRVHRFGPEFTSVDAVVLAMDERGVDRCILSVVPPTFGYRLQPKVTESISRAANDGLALAAEQERVSWFATLPMNAPERALRLLEDAMRSGAAGAIIGSNVAGKNLDDEVLHDFFSAAEEMGAPLQDPRRGCNGGRSARASLGLPWSPDAHRQPTRR